MEVYVPSSQQLVAAHKMFQEKEGRWTDYWRAVRDVETAFSVGRSRDAAQAVADFLKSWNWEYYRHMPAERRRANLESLNQDLDQLISSQLHVIEGFRARSLATLQLADRPAVLALFNTFERIVRPVGTAKSLAVLAPNFFPLWDNPIASAYGVVVGPRGYFLFMSVIKFQVSGLTLPDGLSPLKTLDEYNYCRFTRNWLPRASAATAGSKAPSCS